MRIVCIADLQNQCRSIRPGMLPAGDMLIIAGDLTNQGTLIELTMFNNWLETMEYKHKLVIAGNHDLGLARNFNGHSFLNNCTYLEDELVEIEGVKIYGTPVNECGQYSFFWEFCSKDYTTRAVEQIPNDIDILISHGPPLGILDMVVRGSHVGSPHILEAVQRAKPKVMVMGHIHENHGYIEKDGIKFINAALCDEWNVMMSPMGLARQPFIIDTDDWSVTQPELVPV